MEILDMVVATLTDAVNKANAVAEKIGAATTDRSKRVHELRTDPNTTDPEIRAHQEWYEKATAKLEAEVEAINARITAKYLTEVSEDDVNALKEEYKELKGKVSAARTFAATVPGFSDESLSAVPELKSLRGGSAGTGDGGKRPRIERISFATNSEGPWTEVSVKGKNSKGEEVEKANFTVLAQRLTKESGAKVETKDLQSAAFETAGTEDLSTLNGKVFDFAVSSNSKNYFVRVQPAVKGSAETEDSHEEESVNA